MQTGRMSFANYKTDIVELKGGINENVSSLELLAGELLDCKNYMIAEGGYGGYISTKGYEAYDGAIRPSKYISLLLRVKESTLGITEGQTITGVTSGATAVSLETVEPSEDNTMVVQAYILSEGFEDNEELTTASGSIGLVESHKDLEGGDVDYHLGLEYARSLVHEVPGEGNILGLNIYLNRTYAFRKHIGVDTIGLYKADAAAGWLEVDTSADPMLYTGEHEFYFTNYNFGGAADTFSMFWCDGQNKARVYDGTSVVTIDNTGMGLDDKPLRILGHNYHLWLVYPGGSLQHSQLGDPLVWDGVLGAGEIGLGDDITNIQVGVKSTLVITLKNGIRILSGNVTDDFVLESYSARSGAFPRTVQRLLGTIFFVDDRGLSTLDATLEFGDYSASSISQRFKQTLAASSRKITTTLTSRDLNQYRIFFDDKTAIYVSFEGSEFKGATFMEFDRVVAVAAQGDKDNTDMSIFATNDGRGFVYRMDSGTSFDGAPIICRMSTAFFHYGSPRSWKEFKRATIEISGEQGQSVDVKASFDYNEVGNPRTIWYSPEIYSIIGSATWGEDQWGTMAYGAAAATNRSVIYLQGIGTNMSYKILSLETYRRQHIIQNIITDYKLLSRRV